MIGLTNIKKSYRDGERDINVLNGVSLKIDDGQTLSIMGRSGCGKSTLLHILGGIEHIDGGTYNFDGISMEKCTKGELARIRSTKIGFVFQSYFLIKSLNCIDNVELPLGYVGVKAKERKERALTALEYVGLADYAERNITKLSGGQQQRIAIARAIVSSPSLILADEPTGNLDSETADYTMGLLVELAKRSKSTLIVVTHDTHIASYTDKKYVMKNDGQIYIQ